MKQVLLVVLAFCVIVGVVSAAPIGPRDDMEVLKEKVAALEKEVADLKSEVNMLGRLVVEFTEELALVGMKLQKLEEQP
ncbi:MAG: hypothetical protein JW869_01515 [Candidatus Omnitrophica bacterium]|nr:hypothetical protein [Candidatus Omnitrophota bacterium]